MSGTKISYSAECDENAKNTSLNRGHFNSPRVIFFNLHSRKNRGNVSLNEKYKNLEGYHGNRLTPCDKCHKQILQAQIREHRYWCGKI
jgi:hypothetical protein